MNRDKLEKAIASERFEYYRVIAKLIVENGDLSLEELRKKYGLSHWAINRTRTLFNVGRKKGAGSSAYRKPTP